MTCSDVERVLPEVLDGAPDSEFRVGVETHVKSCPACSDLVSDLKLIASEARQLAATEEPAPRVWVRVAAELRAEGLIREAESAPARPILVPASHRRWNAWWLAPVAAALLAAGSYVVSHKPAPQVAKQVPAAPVAPAPSANSSLTESVKERPVVTPAPTPAPPAQQLAQKSTKHQPMPERVEESAPSTEDQQFLSVVSTLSPAMRITYENQLQAVNNDIRETQAYVNRNPGDLDARQHLIDAYRQKALLYQIALDRIQ